MTVYIYTCSAATLLVCFHSRIVATSRGVATWHSLCTALGPRSSDHHVARISAHRGSTLSLEVSCAPFAVGVFAASRSACSNEHDGFLHLLPDVSSRGIVPHALIRSLHGLCIMGNSRVLCFCNTVTTRLCVTRAQRQTRARTFSSMPWVRPSVHVPGMCSVGKASALVAGQITCESEITCDHLWSNVIFPFSAGSCTV